MNSTNSVMKTPSNVKDVILFNGSNYLRWSQRIKLQLKYSKLWGSIDAGYGSDGTPNPIKVSQDVENEAYARILLSVEERLQGQLLQKTTAKEVWDTLKRNLGSAFRRNLEAVSNHQDEGRGRF